MKTIFCAGIMLMLLSSCGEIAYKRGASPKDLENSKKTCQNAGNETAQQKCLENQGWVVQKLDAIGLPDSELFATASVTDNQNPSKTSNTEPSQAAANVEETNDTKLAASDGNTSKQNNSASNPASSRTAPKPAPNPNEKYRIASWWKMGAGRDALETSINNCTEKLGETHKPDRKTQTFTRAFAACMYESGWRGLREKK